MSAVIRIKRHLNEEPQEAFVLNCKKRKTDGIDITPTSGETSTVLKFAGTVNQVRSMIFKVSNKKMIKVDISGHKPYC